MSRARVSDPRWSSSRAATVVLLKIVIFRRRCTSALCSNLYLLPNALSSCAITAVRVPYHDNNSNNTAVSTVYRESWRSYHSDTVNRPSSGTTTVASVAAFIFNVNVAVCHCCSCPPGRSVRAFVRDCHALDGGKLLWETQNGRCQRVFLHRQHRHVHQLLRRGDRGWGARLRAHHEDADTEYPFTRDVSAR